MKIRTLWRVALPMALVLMLVASCGNKNKQTDGTVSENSGTETEEPVVSDNELFINSDLYNISKKRVIFDVHGIPGADPSFGTDHVEHYRSLFLKEDGTLTVGYVSKTTYGTILQSEGIFYFYNFGMFTKPDDLSYNHLDIFNMTGMVRKDSVLIPMTMLVNGKEGIYMKDCKPTDVLTFVPIRGEAPEVKYTVKQLQDYCVQHGLVADHVPYLMFTDEKPASVPNPSVNENEVVDMEEAEELPTSTTSSVEKEVVETPPAPKVSPMKSTVTFTAPEIPEEKDEEASTQGTGQISLENVAQEEEEQMEETEEVEDNNVYNVVEEMPEYPDGGMQGLMTFIGKNLDYPTIAQENGVQGRVVVQFTIEKDGTPTNFVVKRSVDPYLDKEALRVLKLMPKWKPGKQEGKPVRVNYTVPINFKL